MNFLQHQHETRPPLSAHLRPMVPAFPGDCKIPHCSITSFDSDLATLPKLVVQVSATLALMALTHTLQYRVGNIPFAAEIHIAPLSCQNFVVVEPVLCLVLGGMYCRLLVIGGRLAPKGSAS